MEPQYFVDHQYEKKFKPRRKKEQKEFPSAQMIIYRDMGPYKTL